MDEEDMYDERGNQIGDINSLYQLFAELVFDQDFRAGTDHDDDQAHYFNVAHHAHHYIITRDAPVARQDISIVRTSLRKAFRLHDEDNPQRGVYEITAPPPEC